MLDVSAITPRPALHTSWAASHVAAPTAAGPTEDRVSIFGALEKGIPGAMFSLLPGVGAFTNHVGGKGLQGSMHTTATVGMVANLVGLGAALVGLPNVAGVGLVTSAVCGGIVWGWRGAHGVR